MKLLQLNAWGGRLEPQIGDLLKTENPDIVCLQEAISFRKDGSGLFITIENIQENYDLPFMGFGPVFSFNYMKGTAQFGNCILSRFPIKKTEVIFTHQEHKDNFMWQEDSSNMRNFVHAEVQINGRTCHIITHHGFWILEHKNGNQETLKQTKMIADYIGELSGPTILTGDFNLVPQSPSLQQLNKLLTNLCITHKLKTTRTNLTYKTETCDYIFVNDEVNVDNFQALEKVVSDHKALSLEFNL